MFAGQLQEPPQVFLGDIFAFQFLPLGHPFGPDGGQCGVFLLLDGLQPLFAGSDPCLVLGKELAALRRAMQRGSGVA